MNKSIKITLAILLFLCLADMSYGYYQFICFAAMVGIGLIITLYLDMGGWREGWYKNATDEKMVVGEGMKCKQISGLACFEQFPLKAVILHIYQKK